MLPNSTSYTKDDFNWKEFIKHLPDEKQAVTLLHTAKEGLIKDSDELTLAFQNHDWPRVEYLVDKICDMSLYVGMKNVELLTRQIFQLLRAKNVTHIEEKLIQLEDIIMVAVQAVEQELIDRG